MAYTGSHAQSGYLTVFEIGTVGSTPTFTQIGEVVDFNQTGKTNRTADVTNLNSTAEEFIATLLAPGTYDLTMNRIAADAGQVELLAAFIGKTINPYKITLGLALGQTTAGDSYSFSGLCEEMDDLSAISPSKAVQVKAKIKVSGPITLTAGS